jgi:hypothetical protein
MSKSVTSPQELIRLLLLMSVVNIATTVSAQISLTLGLGLGGNVSEPKWQEPSYPFDEYASARVASIGFLESLNPGPQTRLRLGYAISSFLRVDLEMTYLIGLPQTSQLSQAGQTQTWSEVRSTRMQFTPGLSFSLGERRFSPYLRVGALLPARYQSKLALLEIRSQGEVYQHLTIEARMLPGWTASLGMAYRLNRWLRVFYELEYLAQSALLEQSTLLQYEVEGSDALSELAPFQVKGTFQERWRAPLNQPQQNSFDPQAPLELETRRENLQVLGLNFGIVLAFN